MAYTLVVKMTAPEGQEDRVAELVRDLRDASVKEPGNVHYIAHQDPESPRSFLIYEQYRDEAAFKEHGESEHFQRIALGELFPLVERERAVYETLD